jgi:hypothetical protein
MRKSTLCLAVLTAFAAAGARADDPPKTETPPKAEQAKDRPAAPGQQKQVDKLAAEFGVAKEEVSGLRAKGLGWGEVRHALSLSQKTGKPVADIMKMRESGMGWGEISRKEGVKLGPDAGKGAERGAEGRERGAAGRERGAEGRERGMRGPGRVK